MTIYPSIKERGITPLDTEYGSCEHCRAELWIYSDQFTRQELIANIFNNVPTEAIYREVKTRGPKKDFVSVGVTSDKMVVSMDLRHHLD